MRSSAATESEWRESPESLTLQARRAVKDANALCMGRKIICQLDEHRQLKWGSLWNPTQVVFNLSFACALDEIDSSLLAVQHCHSLPSGMGKSPIDSSSP